MEEKMTSGEMAKQAGVSQKALRIYDEKGLLKPAGYSEGNYKLYDKNSLIILEKIIALKHIGFSLEEIKSNLENDSLTSIKDILENQLEMMNKKIYELQKSAKCIEASLARLDENLDWDDIADIIKKMEMSQGADERRWYASEHAADGIEWYEKIFDSLSFEENDTVLDLGCSYGLLWRKNWERIPKKLQVEGYDIHGNWADDLYDYLKETRSTLPEGSDIQVIFSNLEKEETWERIAQKKYSKIIAHYLLSYLNDEVSFIRNVANVLTPAGIFSVNHYGEAKKEYDFWEKTIKDIGLDVSFALKKRAERKDMDADFEKLLSENFGKVEKVLLPCPLTFDTAEELFDRLLRKYPECRKYLEDNKRVIEDYFDNNILKDGSVTVDMDSTFYHCYKSEG
ncbi:MerR family transcriptional regulator [Butyrivibrio sp. YAB3001]|uniref:MerR family transcriptional regulator n=1 Tax=Butyrivibrio sp. YAB3001 TaxID=1520812 RepID=UPI0008F65C8B|nr:MerR family transcriptional regulator [Butyrivibrio sp. YAB3001]SFC73604.1 DNA-binding transcriptional regulator, MerR family [Butyrivibrio sp. YAB3001]